MHRIEEFADGAIVFATYIDPKTDREVTDVLRVQHCRHTPPENCNMFGCQHQLYRFGNSNPLYEDVVTILSGVEIIPLTAPVKITVQPI